MNILHKISALAKISIEEKMDKFEKDIENTKKMIETIINVDTTNVEPLYNVLVDKNIFKTQQKDCPHTLPSKEEMLKNSSNSNEDFFIVPKTVG